MSGELDLDLDLGKLARSWRLSIEHAQVPLGSFNWPWALGLALDEIDRLREYAEQKRGGQVGYFVAAKQLEERAQAAEAERDAARAQVAAVRELHPKAANPLVELSPLRFPDGQQWICTGCGTQWPCPTVKALDALAAAAVSPTGSGEQQAAVYCPSGLHSIPPGTDCPSCVPSAERTEGEA